MNEPGVDVKGRSHDVQQGRGNGDRGDGGKRRTGQGKAKLEEFVIPTEEAILGKVRKWLRVYFSIVERLPLLNGY